MPALNPACVLLVVAHLGLWSTISRSQSNVSTVERIVVTVNGATVTPFRVYPDTSFGALRRRLNTWWSEPLTIPSDRRSVLKVWVHGIDGVVREGTSDPKVVILSDGCLKIDRTGWIQPDARASCGDPLRPRLYVSTQRQHGSGTLAADFRFAVVGTPQRLEHQGDLHSGRWSSVLGIAVE